LLVDLADPRSATAVFVQIRRSDRNLIDLQR
jgi:hypothetical protein